MKNYKVYIRQYVNREWTNYTASFDLYSNPADGSPVNFMELISNNEFACQLQDGQFQLKVYLDKIDGRLVDTTSKTYYFDRVTIDGKELKPTKFDDYGTYIYKYEAPRDGAVIGVWYHTEK